MILMNNFLHRQKTKLKLIEERTVGINDTDAFLPGI